MPDDKSCDSKNSSTFSGIIETPNYLPFYLKEWSIAAIRTQPSDIILWSATYLRMKANGEHPPIKPYLDSPGLKPGPGGLTPTILKALRLTLCKEFEPYDKVEKTWDVLSLEKSIFLEIIQIGKFEKYIKPCEFIGVAAAYLNNRLRDTMVLLCDTFSKDHSTGISLDDFVAVYQYLARIDGTFVETQDDKSVQRFNNDAVETLGEKTVNLDEENTINFYEESSISHSRSNLDNDFVSENVNEETLDGSFAIDAKSSDGIMVWQDDKVYVYEIPSTILNSPRGIPATNVICGEKRKKLEDNVNDEDLLSLLSDSSIISNPDPSFTSYASSLHDITLQNEQISFEEVNGEEISRKSSIIINDSNYNKEREEEEGISIHSDDIVINIDDVDGEIQGLINDENLERKNTEMENKDSNNEINDEIGDEYSYYNRDNKNNVERNKNIIVMTALVYDEDGSFTTIEADEPLADSVSGESEFSFSQQTEHNDNMIAQTDEENVQIFDESFKNGEKNVENEAIGVSSEYQFSQDDLKIDHSATSEIHSVEGTVTEKMSKDDVVSVTGMNMNDIQQFLSNNESLSTHCRFKCMDEHSDEIINETSNKYEECLPFSKTPAVEPAQRTNTNNKSPESNHVRMHTIPGIGPVIPEKQIKLVIVWVTKCAKMQDNYVQAHNLLHFLCPPLDHEPIVLNNEFNII